MKTYLGIGQREEEFIMAMCPCNSSGDIYHMAAFVILSRNAKKDVPKILLAYDKKEQAINKVNDKNITTGDQVSRALFFVKGIGLGEYFKGLDLSTMSPSGYHECIRQKKLEISLRDNKHQYYIDHRMATSIISNEIKMNGLEKVCGVLNRGFNQLNSDFLDKDVIKKIKKYTSLKKQELTNIVQNNAFIVLHYRFSTHANKNQSLERYTKDIISYLTEKNFKVVVICATSMSLIEGSQLFENAAYTIHPFNDDEIVNKHHDISKFCHLRILHKLLKFRELKGIIGNTSGTLDLAAFIGHKVINIHDFSASDSISSKVDYQDYRLLIQITFLTIVASNQFSMNFDVVLNFIEWLESQKPIINSPLPMPNFFGGTNSSAHNGFSFFSSLKKLENNVERGKWVELSFFPFLREELHKKLADAGFSRETKVHKNK